MGRIGRGGIGNVIEGVKEVLEEEKIRMDRKNKNKKSRQG